MKATEALGNKMAQDNLVLYFTQLWGGEDREEDKKTLDRALEIISIMNDFYGKGNLSRIKHTYTKPGMFGWEAEDGKSVEWISYKGFISRVVRKEGADADAGSRVPCVEMYKCVVAYLMRDAGFSRSYFDPTYSEFASFPKTFKKMWDNADKDMKEFGRSLLELRMDIDEMGRDFQKLVYLDMVNQIVDNKLLANPSDHFDRDQCDSMAKMNSDLFPGRLKVEHSSLGEDLKREIAKKFSFSQ